MGKLTKNMETEKINNKEVYQGKLEYLNYKGKNFSPVSINKQLLNNSHGNNNKTR